MSNLHTTTMKSLITFFGRIVLLCLGIWALASPSAQAQAQITIAKSADTSVVPSGKSIVFTIQYACSSQTTSCSNVVIRDTLATGLTYEGNVGSIHTQSASYSSTSRIVTFNFGSLAAGATGEVQVKAKFPEGITPDGTQIVNRAAIFAGNAATQTSNAVRVTATASSLWQVDKQIKTSSFVDFDITYQVALCSPNAGNLGGLNLQNAQLVDQLPAGATFVSASNSGSYDAATQRVTWNLGTIGVTNGGCTTRTLTVQYPSTLFANNQTVTNRVEGFGTPYGKTMTSVGTDEVGHKLTGFVASPGSTLNKYVDFGEKVVGEYATYTFNVKNSGNVAQDRYVLEDVIPAAFQVSEVYTGAYTANAPVVVRFKTNLKTSWTAVSDTPHTAATTITAAQLGLADSEYITALQWDWGTVPVGFTQLSTAARPGLRAQLLMTDRNGAAVNTGTIVRNCGNLTYVYQTTNGAKTACVNVEVIDPTSRPYPYKEEMSTGPYLPGSTVTYRLRVRNYGLATHVLNAPVLTDLLPTDLVFEEGSWSYDAGNSGMETPLFEALPNHAGTGRTLLRWKWNGNVPINGAAYVTFRAKIKPGTLFGPLPNTAGLTSNIGSVRCPDTKATDVYDQDGDGSSVDQICTYTYSITVQGVAALDAIKQVKGQSDADYMQYPETGKTVPGGTADYRLIIRNKGNVPMTNAVLVDVFPHIGDQGVVAAGERKSEWGPNLMGEVSAPDGVTVYYSTVSNPCRAELNIRAGGCTEAQWSRVLPADITSIRAVKFEFGKTTIAPRDSLVIGWPMRAPAGAPTNGEVAWNSFGYTASRVDTGNFLLAAEPTKVGIALEEIRGNQIGQYFWLDDNRNGVQDKEEKGLNGVKVRLMRVGSDGVAGTDDDEMAAYAFTANDQQGNPGYFLFPNVEDGAYALQFELPKGYMFTKPQATQDEMDSDIAGEKGFTDVFKISNAEKVMLNGGAYALTSDLSLRKTVDNPIAGAGDPVTFSIFVRNDGPDDAFNVVAYDPLHSSLTYQNSGSTHGTYQPTTGEWNIGTLLVGETAELRIAVTMGRECLVYNIAQITASDSVDPDSSPNNYTGQFSEDDVDQAVVNGCSSTSGGNNGGLESNGNLASLIALRNFNRRTMPGLQTEFGTFSPAREKALNKHESLGTILEVVPTTGPLQTEAIVTTPKDLQGITNATSFFAVDYTTVQKRRIAAILANTTPDGSTYEHTKAICDRLNGASMEDVTTITAQDKPFLMATLRHPSGELDYATWFVVYQKDGAFYVENQFRRAEYHPMQTGAEILNFQVWSVVPQITKAMVEEILVALSKKGTVHFSENLPKRPNVLVRSGHYAQGRVLMEVINEAGASEITLNGTLARTESGARIPFSTIVPLPNTNKGSIAQVEVSVASLYDIGFSITNAEDTGTDEVYWADGSWGMTLDAEGSSFAASEIQPRTSVWEEGTFAIDRNIRMNGVVKNWAVAFRTLKAGGRPEDLRAYNVIRFRAKGTGTVKLVMDKASISGWDQYKTTFSLTEQEQLIEIPFPRFRRADGTGAFRADDLTQLAFYVQGNGQSAQAFSMEIADVTFGYNAMVKNEQDAVPTEITLAQNYPNPFNPSTTIGFTIPKAGLVKLTVYDLLGRPVAQLINGQMASGAHQAVFDAASLASGAYWYRLEAGGTVQTRKMLLLK